MVILRTRQQYFQIARVKNAWFTVLCLLGLPSCTAPTANTGDQERISGVYLLERVNGALLPSAITPQQGCNRTARKGIFTISAAGPDVQPMYDWTVTIDAACEPVPLGVSLGADDVGTWRILFAQVSLNSMKGLGSYGASVDETSGGTLAVTLTSLGNSFRFVRVMRWDDPQGVVYVKFVDQSGQAVAGVSLIFTFANGLEGGGTTPASGELGTGGVVGDCKIMIVPPAGYIVPPSQPNPFSVQVRQGPAQHILVSLMKG